MSMYNYSKILKDWSPQAREDAILARRSHEEPSFKVSTPSKKEFHVAMTAKGITGKARVKRVRDTSTGHIERIDVSKEGAGHGSKLLHHTLNEMSSRGFSKATAYIEDQNHASKSLFKKHGFSVIQEGDDGDYWGKSLSH